jgi:hypothetical protein
VQRSTVRSEEQKPCGTLMNISDIRPIFDRDLANGVSLDMPRERKLNDLR